MHQYVVTIQQYVFILLKTSRQQLTYASVLCSQIVLSYFDCGNLLHLQVMIGGAPAAILHTGRVTRIVLVLALTLVQGMGVIDPPHHMHGTLEKGTGTKVQSLSRISDSNHKSD